MKISNKMVEALNTQMTFELQSAYDYMAISAWFKGQNLEGFASFMKYHAGEEISHAQKIYDYLYERRAEADFGALPKPEKAFGSPMEAIKAAFDHEVEVTRRIHALVDLARDENDKATENFLQWFVEEQVEEEALVDDLMQRLEMVGDFRPGLFFLDRELASRGASH